MIQWRLGREYLVKKNGNQFTKMFKERKDEEGNFLEENYSNNFGQDEMFFNQ